MNFKRKFVSVAQKFAVPVNVKYQAYKTERDEFRKIADDEQMSDTEKTYCTFQVTKHIYSGAQKPELKTVIESVRGRLGR